MFKTILIFAFLFIVAISCAPSFDISIEDFFGGKSSEEYKGYKGGGHHEGGGHHGGGYGNSNSHGRPYGGGYGNGYGRPGRPYYG
jgi:hypothetical protein